ncbi:MAG: Orn/Lys/Arg decarboxylase N-terminal domain-containing protein [Negativicutes bacterium]|jgi:arginine decarboxylase
MFDFKFPILVIDEDYSQHTIGSLLVRTLCEQLEKTGYKLHAGYSFSDAMQAPVIYTNLSCIIVSVEAEGMSFKERMDVIREILLNAHSRSPYMPVYLCGERKNAEKLPLDVLRRIFGYIYIYEDTIPFIAGHLHQEITEYHIKLLPPFFRKLTKFTNNAKYSWHTPGHCGGVAFTKTPVGRAFLQFYGERALRSDVSISVSELGSLLDHTGPIGEAEQQAAEIFGADYTFFVTNGTSTANKMVWHAIVAPNDLVLVDRNCHKSLLHVITMIGAIPIYFTPTRNRYGIIGPISSVQFSKKAIVEKIQNSPLAASSNGKIRMAVITNSTYDGICYNADRIKELLEGTVEYLHFDEAWFAYAKFHDFYEHRFGMSDSAKNSKTTVLTTQSTHKLLAALSQAAMIHIKEGSSPINFNRFNEAFMMHSTTSPQYSIIASCDVAAKMMEGNSGRTLIQETLDESVAFRQEMHKLTKEFGKKDWWFHVWEPKEFAKNEPDIDEDMLSFGYYAHDSVDWQLRSNDDWHGFGELEEGFALLDPIKITLLCPGMTEDGNLAESGIPALVASKFLSERGIVVEKSGLYNFLVLFSIGITKSKWNNLIIEMLYFKEFYDKNAKLAEVMPLFCAEYPVYRKMGLRDLCDKLHLEYYNNNTARLMNDIYTVLPEQVLTPKDSYAKFVHGQIDAVAIDGLLGRIAATMVAPYPPGIPLIMPGERFSHDARSIIDYLKFCEQFDTNFPGFESDVHGVQVKEDGNGKRRYFIDCLQMDED